jgi:cyclic pyranopterin phosphate synthase
MVDVSGKSASERTATAQALIHLPAAVSRALRASGHRSKKGPVFETAIIAGVQAVKRTAELIPFCHPLPIDHVEIHIKTASRGRLMVLCTVKTRHVTGVEMEALTGASVAALTIYDMCKALSHDIRIECIELCQKTGGKRAFVR